MKRFIAFAVGLLLLVPALPTLAQFGQFTQGPAAGGGGGSTTAWNPADNSNNTLSTTTVTNDTATSNNVAGRSGTRGLAASSYASGKIFVRFLINVTSSPAVGYYLGFCNSSTVLSTATCTRDDNNGITASFGGFTGSVQLTYNNNTGLTGGNIGTSISSSTAEMEMAFDITGNQVWGRYNSGSGYGAWSNSGNPSTNTGGLVLTSGPTGPYFLYYGDFFETTDVIKIDCSSGTYLTDKPTGFTAC